MSLSNVSAAVEKIPGRVVDSDMDTCKAVDAAVLCKEGIGQRTIELFKTRDAATESSVPNQQRTPSVWLVTIGNSAPCTVRSCAVPDMGAYEGDMDAMVGFGRTCRSSATFVMGKPVILNSCVPMPSAVGT